MVSRAFQTLTAEVGLTVTASITNLKRTEQRARRLADTAADLYGPKSYAHDDQLIAAAYIQQAVYYLTQAESVLENPGADK